jgi:hypothetical protein
LLLFRPQIAAQQGEVFFNVDPISCFAAAEIRIRAKNETTNLFITDLLLRLICL